MTMAAADAERVFAIEVPAGEILAAQESRLLEIAQNLNRMTPRQAVPDAIRQRFGAAVLSEILDRRIKAEVERILSTTPGATGGRAAVQELSFQEGEGLRFRVRVTPPSPQPPPAAQPMDAADCGRPARRADGAWVPLPPGTPARVGDRVICSVEAWVEIEGPEPGAENLLLPVSPAEAEVGEPGRLPPGWWQEVPEGVAWRVSATGRDFGVPFVELHYQGVAPAQSQITVRYPCREEARGVKRLWLEVPWRLSEGALPESCSALLVMGRHGADGAYVDTLTVDVRRPGAMNLVGQRPAAAFDGSEGRLLPGVAVWFTLEEAVDFRLRVGESSLRASRMHRQVRDERIRDGAIIEIGGPGTLPAVSAALSGVREGERREIRFKEAAATSCSGLSVRAARLLRWTGPVR